MNPSEETRLDSLNPWVWNPVREQAAQHVADGLYTIPTIAKKCGIGASTLSMWKAIPAFRARVHEIKEGVKEEVAGFAVAQRYNRMLARQILFEKLNDLIEARAQELKDVPGGATGLLVHQRKMIGSGPAAEPVDEYVYDPAPIKDLREVMNEAQDEMERMTLAEMEEAIAELKRRRRERKSGKAE